MKQFLRRLFTHEVIEFDGIVAMLSVCAIAVALRVGVGLMDDKELVSIERTAAQDSVLVDEAAEALLREMATAESVNVNTSSTYALRRLGFSWYEISMILTFREAGYVFDSISDLRYVNHLDTAHLALVRDKLVFGHDPEKKNISHRNDWRTNRTKHTKRVARTALFLADSLSMHKAGMSEASWLVLKEFQEHYILKGSIGQDTLVRATPQELRTLLSSHVGGERRARSSASGHGQKPDGASGGGEPRQSVAVVELNRATMEQLVALPYVKEKTAKAIVDYRERLGGFVAREQLREVWAVGERYDKIAAYVSVDTTAISKINVNDKNDTRMSRHPYFSKRLIYLIRTTKKSRGKRGPALNRQDMEHIVRGEELSEWFWEYVGYE